MDRENAQVATAPSGSPASERLESWKEIAAYLKRDVSTAKRWEKREGLPVYRHLHDKLGTVYAYRSELDVWWNNRQPRPEAAAPPRRWVAAAAAVVLPVVLLVWGWAFLARGGRLKLRHQVPPRATRPGRLLAQATGEGKQPALLPAGKAPDRVAITPNGAELYLTDYDGAVVSVLNTATQALTHTVQVIQKPSAIVAAPDGHKVYVGSAVSDLSVIDTATKAVSTIHTDGPVIDLAITPDGRKLFLAAAYSGLKRVLTATGEVTVIPGTICPMYLALNPQGTRLYVSYQCGGPGGRPGHDSIDILDVTNETSLGSITGLPLVGGPIAISPSGAHIWVSGWDVCEKPYYDHRGCPSVPGGVVHVLRTSDNAGVVLGHSSLVVVDATSFTILETAEVAASRGIVFAPDGRRAYAPARSRGAVAVFDLLDDGCQPPSAGLVSFWPADGNGNDVRDGRPGALHNGAGFAPGLVGQAFRLDGKDDFVSFGKTNEVFFSDPEAALSLWVKFGAVDGEMSVLSRMSPAADSGWRFFKREDNRFVFCLGSALGPAGCLPGSSTTLASATVAAPDAWYHLAVVKTRTEVSLYINGTLEAATYPGVFQDRQAFQPELQLGADERPGRFLNGLVDEVALYNRALSAAEVQSIFQAGKLGSCEKN
ncbi:MAG: hypothetical protein HY236_15020 [Acidobacteria bacterium]|nr:hypothetical protein [Acidobacteriota bacterium]